MYIIGIDCAVEDRKIGLAQLQKAGQNIRLLKVETGSKSQPAITILEDWVAEVVNMREKVLLCFDGPLGWPFHFGESLQQHQAGERINVDSDLFFRRRTDNIVHALLGKRPLDVTASFIARTAFRALGMIGALKKKFGTVELTWDIQQLRNIGCIEVYPAAWLISEGIAHEKYKQQQSVRRDVVNQLEKTLVMNTEMRGKLIASDHMLDAVLSGLNGVDFAENRCASPDEWDIEKNVLLKEGWIWVKPGGSNKKIVSL